MMVMEELRILGIDVANAVNRFMGNEDLYRRMLKKLPEAIKENYVDSDFDIADCDSIAKKCHTIKGVTGNLSVTPLYVAYTDIVQLMRNGQIEDARGLLIDILPKQKEIIEFIEENV